jgi:O-antigen/teichoic acid export membrane protein
MLGIPHQSARVPTIQRSQCRLTFDASTVPNFAHRFPTLHAMPRIQDHLPKLSWVAADKLLFVLYGGIAILQIRALPPAEYGLYALLVSIQTWIFVVADGLLLQGVIQFGADRTMRPVVDGTVAVLYTIVIAVIVAAIAVAQPALRQLFGEPRFADVARLEIIFCAVTIPRTFCLRLLMRDIQSRQIFWINAAWLGTMTLATVHGITAGWLGSFESLAAIAIGGMAISSAVAAILTRGILRPMRFRKDQVKPLLHFGARQMTASVIHTSVRQLDVALAQTFFGTAAVGVYQAAKTIFRFFELGLDAATSVVYPAAVTYHASGDCAALDTVTSKAISTLTVAYVAATAAVWSAGDAIGLVLGSRYAAAAGMLRTLSLASLVMPLGMTGVVLVAAGAIAVHARITVLAAVAAFAWFLASGILQRWELFPVGIVAYYAVLGAGDWWAFQRRNVGVLRLSDLWRILPDTWRFLRKR